jgi:orotate phosphoribosyltransferase
MAAVFTGASHLRQPHDPKKLRSLVRRTKKVLLELRGREPFDAIAFSGVSGAAVAYPISMQTDIPLLNVRKADNSHGSPIEGSSRLIGSYIIVDDLIESGTTIRRIVDALAERNLPPTACKAIVLWYAAYMSAFTIPAVDGTELSIPIVPVRR